MFTLTIEDKHGGVADEYSFEEGEFLVGRSHSADIILPSDNVSRRHARLYTVDGRCYIEDLGSANGVFVNGRRIHEVFEIEGAAQVKVGDYYLHIKSDAAPAVEDQVFCRLHGRNLSVADQIFRITRTVNLVGRGKDCTITVIDPSVSRIHGKLSVERSGALTLEDLKSSNGTFVNGERIEIATLNHRDILRFGNVEFMVEFPDLQPGDGKSPPAAVSAAGEAESAWSAPEPPSNRGMWVVVGVVGSLVVVGLLVMIVFSDALFGSGEAEKPAADASAAPAADAAVKPLVEEEKMSTEEEIEMLLEEGRAQVKNRQWKRALETFTRVLERDPLHTEARKAVNQVKVFQKDQTTLEHARGLVNVEKQYAEAAKALREIDEGSLYFLEAQEELKRLLTEIKPVLVMQANALVKQRDCEGALSLYEKAQQLDPRDEELVVKIAKTKRKLDNKCR